MRMARALAVSGSPRPMALAVGLTALLTVLATLQYRWTGEVSRAERERMENGLRAATVRCARDLDREVAAIVPFFFQPGAEIGDRDARYAAFYAEWMASGTDSKLLRDVLLVEPGPNGAPPRLLRFDPDRQRFEPTDWTSDLEPLRRRPLEVRGNPIVAEVPAIVLPVTPWRRREPRAAGLPADGIVVLRLDASRIVEMLPELAERSFGDADFSVYELAVVRRTREGESVVYRSPGAALESRKPDIVVPLLDMRGLDETRGEGFRAGGRFGVRRRGLLWGGGSPPPSAGAPPAWELRVTHRAGSLEAAVARVRTRNLSVGLGVLLLLAASVVFVVVSAQRAQRLAHQQLQFVAAVSHEMHTPLAAIRSAGANLADGVVNEPGQVQRYGSLIETEGRRLSSMVTQALEFAGIQSGRQQYRLEPVAVADVVNTALDACRWSIEEKNVNVEREVPESLPPIRADLAAMRTAVKNLVENALKYGDPAHPIVVGARAAGGEVSISVGDRGPGIAEADRARIFEPFYRGAPNGAPVQGSGLGLAVVRHVVLAHGGRVDFVTGADGTTFTIHLPAAPAQPVEARA